MRVNLRLPCRSHSYTPMQPLAGECAIGGNEIEDSFTQNRMREARKVKSRKRTYSAQLSKSVWESLSLSLFQRMSNMVWVVFIRGMSISLLLTVWPELRLSLSVTLTTSSSIEVLTNHKFHNTSFRLHTSQRSGAFFLTLYRPHQNFCFFFRPKFSRKFRSLLLERLVSLMCHCHRNNSISSSLVHKEKPLRSASIDQWLFLRNTISERN